MSLDSAEVPQTASLVKSCTGNKLFMTPITEKVITKSPTFPLEVFTARLGNIPRSLAVEDNALPVPILTLRLPKCRTSKVSMTSEAVGRNLGS